MSDDPTTRQPQVGYWHSYCCSHDLSEIEDEDDVQNVFEMREDSKEDGKSEYVFETRHQGLEWFAKYENDDGAVKELEVSE